MTKNRRALVEGIESTSDLTDEQRNFVYGNNPKPIETNSKAAEPQTVTPTSTGNEPRILPNMAGRVPVTIRCRPELASAVKRASLQRQMDGISPFHMQEILEEALEAWMKNNGYTT